MTVKAVPEGWHAVTPRLFVAGAAKLVSFLKHTFGATGSFRNDGPSEIHIGDSHRRFDRDGQRGWDA
jgi:hypothetical protein